MVDDETVDTLVQASFTVIAVISRIAAEGDQSLTLGRMLGILRDRTPRMADLADHLGVERSTLSGLVDRAERRGLVAREADAVDARATRVTLTAEGRRLAEDGHAEVAAALTPLLSRLDDADLVRLTQLLGTLLGDQGSRPAPLRALPG